MRRLFPARLQAALSGDRAGWFEPPPELLREARRRIRLAALLGAVAYGLFLAVLVAGLGPSPSLDVRIGIRHDLLGIVLCLALFGLATLPAASDRLVLGFALAFEVVLAGVISTHAPWAAFVRTGHAAALTWVVPLVILFALLVPLPTPTIFLTSLASVITTPLGLMFLAWRGKISLPWVDLGNAALTSGVALGIATLAARSMHGARRQVAAARTVGSYELIERIGQGGMGEVWRGRHLMLARPAAIKLILAETLSGASEERNAVLERFRREARVTAGLRSPHTVTLFDFGVAADDSLYYAMELLEGLQLEHFVYRYGPLEPRRVVHLLRQACHSLAEAHERGLVHRDIKPANLMLCRYGRDTDFLKVLDFGLTKPVAERGPNLTEPGIRLGTPSYMAPEQVFGLPSEPATDLYALGCVGYFLLAGEKPFNAESAGELMRQHAQASPPALGKRATQGVPPRLEAALMHCLSKMPEDRPRDAEELSRELAGSLPEPAWSEDEARLWWERHLPLSAPSATPAP